MKRHDVTRRAARNVVRYRYVYRLLSSEDWRGRIGRRIIDHTNLIWIGSTVGRDSLTLCAFKEASLHAKVTSTKASV